MKADPRPLAPPAPLWRERHDAPTFANRLSHGRRRPSVLVVEDNPVQALLITLMLERHGVEITLVTNGAQAVEAVMNGAYSLVLMDYLMPVTDGIEATRLIRRWEQAHHRVPTPIVAVTASAMARECEAYRAAGMDDVVIKPFSADALAGMLARHGCGRPHGTFVQGEAT